MKQSVNIGFIGIGNMGSGMAARLLGLGWAVALHDIDARRVQQAHVLGARVHAAPPELALACDCGVVRVVDAQQTDSILLGPNGAAAALAGGMSLPGRPKGEYQSAQHEGTPVSLMVASAPPVFERHRALIESLSSQVFRVSERAGDGARTKRVNNLLAGINLAGAAECRRWPNASGWTCRPRWT